jgi:hypothetical protein
MMGITWGFQRVAPGNFEFSAVLLQTKKKRSPLDGDRFFFNA